MTDFDVDAYMDEKSDGGDTRTVVMPAGGANSIKSDTNAGNKDTKMDGDSKTPASAEQGSSDPKANGKTDDRKQRRHRSSSRGGEKRRTDRKSRRSSRSVSGGRGGSRRDHRDRRGPSDRHARRRGGGRSRDRNERGGGGGSRYAQSSRGSNNDRRDSRRGGRRSRSRSKSAADGNDSDEGLDMAQRREKRELLALTRDARTVSVSQLQVKVTEKDLKAYFKSVCKVREIVLLKDKHTNRSKGVAYVELKTLDDVPQALLLDNKPFIFRDGHSGFPISVKGSEAEKNFNHKLQKRLAAIGMASAAVDPANPVTPGVPPTAAAVAVPGAAPFMPKAAAAAAAALQHHMPVNVAAQAAAQAAPILAAAGIRNNLTKPPPYGRLFVGNLPMNINDDMLRAAFGEFGAVVHAKVSKDTAGMSKGFAHVQFTTPEEAAAALIGMNGETVAGQVLQVKPVTQKPTTPYPTGPAPGMPPGYSYPPGTGYPAAAAYPPAVVYPPAAAVYPPAAGYPATSAMAPPPTYYGSPAVAGTTPGSAAAVSAAAAAATQAAAAAKVAAFAVSHNGGVSASSMGQQEAYNNPQAADNLNQGRAGGGTGVSLNSSTRSMLMQTLAGGAATEIVSAEQQQEMQRLALEQQTRAAAATAPKQNGAGPIQGILSQYILVRNMFDPVEETEPEWDVDIKEDTIAECSKFGKVLHCAVEKESKGFVYLCFGDLQAAQTAADSLHGRWFGQRMLQVEFMKAAVYKEKHPF